MSFNLDRYIETYDVHPETVTFLQDRASSGTRASYEIGVEAARNAALIAADKYGGHSEFVGEEYEIIVPASRLTDDIPVTVYKPDACRQTTSPPILVYFHGGGNVTKCRKTHENVCKTLASITPCIVMNVEYRLAPEHRFPANHDDTKRVVEWSVENKQFIGGSVDSKIGVAGDSAGGYISAVVCHEAKGLIDFAILVYPKVSFTKVYPSTEEFKNGPMLPKRLSDWFSEQYITEEEMGSTKASVILNTNFSSLPPTLIIVAEHDQLRDGCYEYYKKLKEAHVTVDIKLIKGVPHTFWSLPGAFKTTCREAYKTCSEFIREHSS